MINNQLKANQEGLDSFFIVGGDRISGYLIVTRFLDCKMLLHNNILRGEYVWFEY